jgi:hypothetical protein
MKQSKRMITEWGETVYNPEYPRYRTERRKRWIDKYKISQGCEICGYNEHAVALDFDHINPDDKSFSISGYLIKSTLLKLFNEIRKCRVICSNCHRVHSSEMKHHNMGGPKRGRSKKIVDEEFIRREYNMGLTLRQLAVSYKISVGLAHKIVNGDLT